MTCDEKEAIHICATTKVIGIHMMYICGKIRKYCGNDLAVETRFYPDNIEVSVTERGGSFTVRIGDVWAHVREQLHCC
jgi:hypothetical protein